MTSIEKTILESLLLNEEYMRKVIPFIKKEYFSEKVDRVVFEEIFKFVDQYKSLPNKATLKLELEKNPTVSEQEYKNALTLVESFSENEFDSSWLLDSTEKWCQDRAIYNALMESIKIADGKDKDKSRNAIPDILTQALSVSFDQSIGHDYINEADKRFEYYHNLETRLPTDLTLLNKITKGGFPPKTLNLWMGSTGGGKTLTLCHLAAAHLMQGKNVLYITLEMAEERIAERIDANLLNITIDDLKQLPKSAFDNKIQALSNRTKGKLIIKEYPPVSAHVGHFKALLADLEIKKSFKPDIIIVDYINICASSRLKASTSNSYSYIKSIAEEIRSLAVDTKTVCYSSTQVNRNGFSNSEVEVTDISDSIGLAATVDFLCAIISTEELDNMGQILFKQLKNRYSDVNYYKKFVVGIDRSKMRLYDVDSSAQDDILLPKEEEYEYQENDLKNRFSDFKI